MPKAPLIAALLVCTAAPLRAAEPPPAANGDRQAEAQETAFFEKRVRPLLARRCYECHSSRAKKLQGALRLDTRAGLMAGGDTGPAVKPGDPDASLLIQAVRYAPDSYAMPPRGKLPDAEIALLTEWVKRGAVFPTGSTKAVAKRQVIDFAAGRRFWSFRPLAESVSKVELRSPRWVQRGVDRFILAQLEARGLAPSQPADHRELIRRATFDLTGLPPTPEEVAAFLGDNSPEAYPALIERLLASPHYGERWARWWLDLARYTDATSKWLTTTGQAYLYRDWVVAAFNRDVPYDAFVRRQLANDQLPDATPEDMAALGFLGLSPTYWKELKLAPDVIKVIVADEWDERLDAVTRTFLGLTVACARCHDHKFDPISTDDYYALAGVFASTRLCDVPLIPSDRAEPALAARRRVETLSAELKRLKAAKTKQAREEDADTSQQSPSQRIAEIEAQIEEARATPDFDMPLAHGVTDAALYVLPNGPDATKLEYKPGEARDLHIFARGDPNRPGTLAPRRFLTVLSSVEPEPFAHGGGRLDLANAIFTQAAPLAARVVVNRVWLEHFGRGLVETPSNFGAQGDRPSHPALLDDLARRFIEHGWSFKWLHREIMLSAAYQQTSQHDDRKHAIDPDNRLLWRMNRRRLDVEAWRDAMLAATGELDGRVGGPAQELDDAANLRRTLYGLVNRRDVAAMLRLYDFPDPTSHSPRRQNTTTPLQQLFVLNSPFVQRRAAALVKRLETLDQANTANRVRAAYRVLFGREATG